MAWSLQINKPKSLLAYKLISNQDFSQKGWRAGRRPLPGMDSVTWSMKSKTRQSWGLSKEPREQGDSSDIEQNQLETSTKQRMPVQGAGWKGQIRFSELPFFDSGMCPGELFRKISKSHSEGPNVASCKIRSKKEKRKESRRGGGKSQSCCLPGREKKVSDRSW